MEETPPAAQDSGHSLQNILSNRVANHTYNSYCFKNYITLRSLTNIALHTKCVWFDVRGSQPPGKTITGIDRGRLLPGELVSLLSVLSQSFSTEKEAFGEREHNIDFHFYYLVLF